MTTLYRPIDVLTQAQAATTGVLHVEDDGHGRAMWLVPVEVEEIQAENRGGFFVTERHAAYPFTAYYLQSAPDTATSDAP